MSAREAASPILHRNDAAAAARRTDAAAAPRTDAAASACRPDAAAAPLTNAAAAAPRPDALAAARRILQRADELAAFTEEPGRITRPLASPALAAAMDRVREWMEAAGLTTRSDALGNLVGRREATAGGAPRPEGESDDAPRAGREAGGAPRPEGESDDAPRAGREVVGAPRPGGEGAGALRPEAEGAGAAPLGGESDGAPRPDGEGAGAPRPEAEGAGAARAGGDAGGAPGTIVVGSHLDSVADAGRYDGILGVLVGLEVAEAARELPAALEVVAFADEEGLRFQSTYLGSRAYVGRLEAAELAALRDPEGVTLGEAIGASAPGPALLPADIRAYFEVHIEQGPVLEAAGLPLGVVTAIAGQNRFNVAFTGRAGHAGTTPMPLRRDALGAAAEFVLAAERAAREEPGLVATVGELGIPHGACNVIAGRVEGTLDIRHHDDATLARAIAGLRAEADAICARRGVEVAWEPIAADRATPCNPALVARLAEAVAATGAEPHELPSGAGHDAVTMAGVTDVAMLFVRCAGGISHHPDESVEEADVALAVEAAVGFVRRLAEEPAASSRERAAEPAASAPERAAKPAASPRERAAKPAGGGSAAT